MRIRTTLAAGLATLALAAIPAAAHAATLNVNYDVTGTSHVSHTDSDLWIRPTTLSISNDTSTNTFTGHLPIAPADTKFHVLGFLPIKATVNFIEAAPLTGVLGRGTVSTTASYYLRLSDVLVGGIPTYVGNNCRTVDPIVINASNPAGTTFNITSGGELTGTFSVGDFQNCSLQTWLINQLVPGDGNTVDLQVTNGVATSAS